MKRKVLILVNHDVVIYNFRRELVQSLLADGYEVVISSPYGERIPLLQEMGCRYLEVSLKRHGMNPLEEWKLLMYYKRIMRDEKPDVVLTYTIKPNLYGGMAAKAYGIPYIANITGLGMAVEHPGLLQRFLTGMYRRALKEAKCVFCQNESNLKWLKAEGIGEGKLKLLPGSGVNLEYFSFQEYPQKEPVRFAFISRIMKDKGIEEYLEAAAMLKASYKEAEFHICGFCEEAYEKRLKQMEQEGIIRYHGMVQDIRSVLETIQCVVLPSYHEGMSNALLEAAATGRPLIATDVPGCRECLEPEKSGFLVRAGDAEDLAEKIEQFLQLPYEERKAMGLASRKHAERCFDRRQIIEAYRKELSECQTLL